MIRRHAFVLGVAYCVGCLGLVRAVSMNAHTKEEAPVRRVALTVDPSARHNFFDRLEAFAKREAFEFRVTPTRPGEEYFLVSMWRDDVDILGSNALDPRVFRVLFFLHSGHDLTRAKVDALANELEESVVFPGSATLAPAN